MSWRDQKKKKERKKVIQKRDEIMNAYRKPQWTIIFRFLLQPFFYCYFIEFQQPPVEILQSESRMKR